MNYHGTDVIILRPNESVFGDGTHESTQMVLEALYQLDPEGKKVLDIGTGTGIQSIFAKKWGAKEVYAVDVSVVAIETARKNFLKNNVEVISELNIYNELLDFKADIIIANLPIQNLQEFLPMAKDTLVENGVILFSWDRRIRINELDLSGYRIVKHLEGIDYDSYIIEEETI